jgi:hypothetical protein
MRKEVKITVPTDWSAVSLRKYLQLQDDMENYKDDKDAQNAFLLFHLCDLTPEVITQLDVETISNIKQDLEKFLNKQDYELVRIVKIGDIEYGFEPNLSEMAYGAYLDLSKYETLNIDKNWSTVMSILYREVTKKKGSLYEIKPYTGITKQQQERWMDVSMDVHFSTFFFFNRIYKDLLNAILKSLKEGVLTGETQHPHIQQILHESGEAIKALQSLQERTYSNLMR